jgi:hypothetical protein
VSKCCQVECSVGDTGFASCRVGAEWEEELKTVTDICVYQVDEGLSRCECAFVLSTQHSYRLVPSFRMQMDSMFTRQLSETVARQKIIHEC